MVNQRTMQAITRRAVFTGLAVLLVLGLVGTASLALAHHRAAAQDTSPAAGMAGDGLIGVWQMGPSSLGPEPIWFAIFHADGTFESWDQVAGEFIGLWRMTGERTFDLVNVATDANPAPDAWAPGTATFTLTGELDPSGNAFTVTGTIDVRDAGGAPIATVPWSAPAVRMTFESNPATGSIPATPTAGTPVS